MKSILQQPVKSHRAKQIENFLNKYFSPVKRVIIPTEQQIKIAVLKQVASEKGTKW